MGRTVVWSSILLFLRYFPNTTMVRQRGWSLHSACTRALQGGDDLPQGLMCKTGGTLNPKGFPSTSFFSSAALMKDLAFPYKPCFPHILCLLGLQLLL